MKALTVVLSLCLGLTLLVGCANKNSSTTPQYQAAVVSDDFVSALQTFCGQAASFHASGVITDALNTKVRAACATGARADKSANLAIATNNLTGATGALTEGLNVLQALGPESIGIKDQNSQLLFTASLNAAIGALEIKLGTIH